MEIEDKENHNQKQSDPKKLSLFYSMMRQFLEIQCFSEKFLQEFELQIDLKNEFPLLTTLSGSLIHQNLREYMIQLPNLIRSPPDIIQVINSLPPNPVKRSSPAINPKTSHIVQKTLFYAKQLENPNQFSRRNLKKRLYFQNEFDHPQIYQNFALKKTILGHSYSQESGMVHAQSEEPYIPVYQISFDQTEKIIVTGDAEGLLKIWAADTGLLINNLKGHNKTILTCRFSPCNKYLASSSQDGTARIWDYFTGKTYAVFRQNLDEPMGDTGWYLSQITNTLYFLVTSDKGFVYIYKEEDFKDNNGVLVRDQKVIKLQMEPQMEIIKGGLMVEPEKLEVFTILVHKEGNIIASNEYGQIVIWPSIDLIEKDPELYMYNPIIWKEHHLVKFKPIKLFQSVEMLDLNKDENLIISTSKDGSAKLWEFDSRNFEKNRTSKSLNTFTLPEQFMQYGQVKRMGNHKAFMVQCENAQFSSKGRYAIITFRKYLKRIVHEDDFKQEYSFVIVYDILLKKYINLSNPLIVQDVILVVEPHPQTDNVIMYAQYNTGIIVLYDIKNGVILNQFQERAYVINFPNTECPILNGVFSKDGRTFNITTYFGTFSIYSIGNGDFYKSCPTEQFYSGDYEPYELTDDLRVMSLDVQEVEISDMERGRICNYKQIPYQLQYNNNMKSLRNRQFFSVPQHQNKLLNDEQQIQQQSSEQQQREENIFWEKWDNQIEEQVNAYRNDEVYQQHYNQDYQEANNLVLSYINKLKQFCIQKLSQNNQDISHIIIKEIKQTTLKKRPSSVQEQQTQNVQIRGTNRRLHRLRNIQSSQQPFQDSNQFEQEQNLNSFNQNYLTLPSTLEESKTNNTAWEKRKEKFLKEQKEQYMEFLQYDIDNSADANWDFEQEISKKRKGRKSRAQRQEQIQQFQSEGQDEEEEQYQDEDIEELSAEGEHYGLQAELENLENNVQNKRTRNRGQRLKRFDPNTQIIHQMNLTDRSTRRQLKRINEDNNLKRKSSYEDDNEGEIYFGSTLRHKKMKIEDESDDINLSNPILDKRSESKKERCVRCYKDIIQNQKRQCQGCDSNFFHHNCAKLRGVSKQNQKFWCFNCYARRNYNKPYIDNYCDGKKQHRDYYSQRQQIYSKYVPQVGDEVYYIFQAHEEYLHQMFEIQNNFLLVIDHLDDDSDCIVPFNNNLCLFNEIVKLKVVDIEYQFSVFLNKKSFDFNYGKQDIQMLLTLECDSPEKFSFKTFYSVNQINFATNFLVPAIKLNFALSTYKMLRGTEVQTIILNEAPTEIVILENSPKESCFDLSTYLTLSYRSIDDQKYQLRHQHNIDEFQTRISYWDIANQQFEEETSIILFEEDEQQQILNYFQILLNQKEEESINFMKPVDTKIWREYLQLIELPIDISLIQDRIQNNYYRSKQQIIKDIELIYINAQKFNDPASSICQQAKLITQDLIHIINNYQDQEAVMPQLFPNKKKYQMYLQNIESMKQSEGQEEVEESQEEDEQNEVEVQEDEDEQEDEYDEEIQSEQSYKVSSNKDNSNKDQSFDIKSIQQNGRKTRGKVKNYNENEYFKKLDDYDNIKRKSKQIVKDREDISEEIIPKQKKRKYNLVEGDKYQDLIINLQCKQIDDMVDGRRTSRNKKVNYNENVEYIAESNSGRYETRRRR